MKQQSQVLKRDFTDLTNKVQCLNIEVFFSGPLPTVRRRGDERFSRLMMLKTDGSNTHVLLNQWTLLTISTYFGDAGSPLRQMDFALTSQEYSC